jgi:hypothetical protein
MKEELMDMANKTLELMPPDNHCRELYWSAIDEELEAFAALVAAAEREACAELCEGTYQEHEAYTGQPKALNYTCAKAIRARGETK